MHTVTTRIGQGCLCWLCFVVLPLPAAEGPGAPTGAPAARDMRRIDTGLPIPDQGYCDQPYVIVTHDGNWLCTLTTGPGHEGAGSQHVVSTISNDRGRTWSKLVDIEPASGPEASWVVPLVVPSGRVYAFYTYNGDRVNRLPGRKGKVRADMMGWYVYRFSDDNGRSWSPRRYRLPMRVTACDRTNNWQGKVQIFWGICKPLAVGRDVYFSFTKLGRYMLDGGEGWLYRSSNILAESDVAKIDWQLLPDGEHGIRAARFGSVQEEHNLVPLADGDLYCVYRTTTGYPCHTYSRDGGRTWETPTEMTYTPGGRKIKTPRACPKVWRTKAGRYLFWFHNHGGRSFADRNPVWISGGMERDGRIHWSQPEILLYDPTPATRMSYPDLIEQDGNYWVTETQKTIARIHRLDNSLLAGLWSQGRVNDVARDGLLIEVGPGKTRLPEGIDLAKTGGVSLDLWTMPKGFSFGDVLADTRTADGRGIAISITNKGTARICLSDGRTTVTWDSDPGLFDPGKRHHIAAIVDAGPKIVTFVVDGQLCDGGAAWQFGWGRYEGKLGQVSGSGELRVAPSVARLRVYRRYLRTSEAIGNFHAGP